MPTLAAPQPARRPAPANLFTAPVVVGALTLTLGGAAVAHALGFGSGQDQMSYLRNLPTRTATVPEGGGINDAMYAVDPGIDQAAPGEEEGVQEILKQEVKSEEGSDLPQPDEELDVPVVPDAQR